MFFFNQIISYILYNLGYLVITPKSYSFGGFYHSIIYGLKLSNLKNKKNLFAIPLINLQESSLNIYHTDLLLRLFKNCSFFQKTLSLFLSINLNLNIIILLILKRILFSKYHSKYVHWIFSDYIGYSDRNNELDFFLKKLDLSYSALAKSDINLSNLYKKQKSKIVCFSIKDDNYSKIKTISNHLSSDVYKCKKSLNYLLEEGCKISKVGENLMRKFEFNHQNYQDLCYEKNHNNLLNKTHAESLFYFGSSSSLGLAAEVFKKKKFVINETDHIEVNQSTKSDNFIIFKKILCSKSKEVIKINELFKRKLVFNEDILIALKNNEIYLEENSENEIFDGLIEFYEHNYKNRKIKKLSNKEYFDMRNNYLIKNCNQPINSHYKDYIFSIPETYLNKYLI